MHAYDRFLPEWFNRIRSRQITLPRFQRFVAWGHSEVSGLLTSVLRGELTVPPLADNLGHPKIRLRDYWRRKRCSNITHNTRSADDGVEHRRYLTISAVTFAVDVAFELCRVNPVVEIPVTQNVSFTSPHSPATT